VRLPSSTRLRQVPASTAQKSLKSPIDDDNYHSFSIPDLGLFQSIGEIEKAICPRLARRSRVMMSEGATASSRGADPGVLGWMCYYVIESTFNEDVQVDNDSEAAFASH
jgi:hypothetical protein